MIRIFIVFLFSLTAFAQSHREVLGRVLDMNSKPVPGAIVSVRAVTRETGTRYGTNDDVDPTAVTDAKGVFAIHGRNPFQAVTVVVEANGFAKAVFPELPAGGSTNELKLSEGVSISGVLMQKRAPVVGAKIGVSDVDATSKIFVTDLRAVTDSDGRFTFTNVPPRHDFVLYGFMSGSNTLPARRISAGVSGSTIDLGELIWEQGLFVEGRIVPAATTKIILGRDGPRDTLEAMSDTEGRFRFEGVPAEVVSITAKLPGQRLALRNGSLAPLEPDRLLGRVTTNTTGLILQFEPGETLSPLDISPSVAREEPLTGSEAPRAGPGMIEISATVLDAETKTPISQFVASEGRYNRDGGFDWIYTRRQEGTNGALKTYLRANDSRPALVFEAEGYLPWTTSGLAASTNLTVALKRGLQARGVVLQPNGAPATNVLIRLIDLSSQIFVNGDDVQTSGGQATRTDASGRFQFRPHAGVFALFVNDALGFAAVPIDDVTRSGEVRLKPWGRVEGNLMVGNAAGANEMVVLQNAPFPYEWFPRELPAFNFLLHAQTDTNGNFVFARVPPLVMEIGHAVNAPPPLGTIPFTQSRRIEVWPDARTTVDLGGSGRTLTGRFEMDSATPVNWAEAAQSMELSFPNNGPADAAMKALLQKLRETVRLRLSPYDRAKAEEEYQRARKAFALDSQRYFASDAGRAEWLAQRRYFLSFAEDGSFHVNDVLPGKYNVALRILDPARSIFKQTILGEFSGEITVPDDKKNTPIDVGVFRVLPVAKK